MFQTKDVRKIKTQIMLNIFFPRKFVPFVR